MTEFFEQTWFAWWIVASLITLRWFHIISLNHEPEDGFEQPETDGSVPS